MKNNIIYEKFLEIGCCTICSLRFTGETNAEAFKACLSKSKTESGNGEEADKTETSIKKVASNACVACLGMLQSPMCKKIIDQIVEAVSKEEYDNPTYNIAFTLPVSFYLRAHSILVFLVENYPEYFKENFPLGVITVGVKDAWKYAFSDQVSQGINKIFSNDSDFRIQVDIQYEDDHSEIECLTEIYPNKFKEQKIKTRKLRHIKGPTSQSISRKSVEALLDLRDRERFAKFCPVPPSVPTHSAKCNNALFEQGPIYIAGRYNKFLRGLPQTAWMVQDQRRMETSVHELIGDHVQAVTKATGSKLIASGREDVDVRMLGSGRPFALELISPRHVVLPPAESQALVQKINTEAAGKVAVSMLKVIPKSAMELLKHGEEKKTKTYEAYCVVWNVNANKLLEVSQKAPLTLEQKTPMRVLHRRPIATRPRTIHWMTISDVKPSEDEGTTYFKLQLNTQAGTYIKEFVHGDFGRTRPSLGDLLGGVTADCLALDVLSIELDWPP